MRHFLRNTGRWCIQHPQWLERIAWGLAGVCVLAGLWACWYAHVLAQCNRFFLQPTQLARLTTPAVDARWAYARGLALQADPQTADLEQVLKQFYLPESSPDPVLRAYAKFAIGNVYFDWAMMHHAVAQGGAHQQQVAMIALAREAYKDALRLDPAFAEARFNLELLDRRSPDKRTQGWQSETDGVTLKPFKRNGTAMMRDNRRRGLP